MPRGVEKQPGLKKLPGVPYRAGDLGPNMADVDERRGAFKHVPREPINRCMDFGGPTLATGGIGSPASATFLAGSPRTTTARKDVRILPETQLTGSMNTMGGLGTPKTSRQLGGEGGPLLKD